LRYWISRREEPARLIGLIHLSQVARGPFQNAMLGYGIDQRDKARA
jgi:ribosomal-protein-alanine N-acetyltransferase